MIFKKIFPQVSGQVDKKEVNELKMFMPGAAKSSDYFNDISLTKVIVGKEFKKSRALKLYLQLSFK